MRKPKVAGGAPASADDHLAKAIAARMEDPAPIGRTKSKLVALREFSGAMDHADSLYDTDKAEAVSRAAHAAMDLCNQLGIGHATRPLMGLVYALEDRKRGRTTDWLTPVNFGGGSTLYEEERHDRVVAVATLQVLCDHGRTVKGACIEVAKTIATPANGITSMTIASWRERVLDYCTADLFHEIVSRARRLDPEQALQLLARRRYSTSA